MQIGFGILHLAPQHFWAMTPRELDAACAAIFPTLDNYRPPKRDVLTKLISRFPDNEV